AVDRLLSGKPVGGERRVTGPDGTLRKEVLEAPEPEPEERARTYRGPTRICAYALSPMLVERAIKELRIDAVVVDRPDAADLVLVLHARCCVPRLRCAVELRGLRDYSIKRNGSSTIRRAQQEAFLRAEGLQESQIREAVEDAEAALQRVL